MGHPWAVDAAERFRLFAEHEARGRSPSYERIARAVAADPGLLGLIEELPPAKRQPNLLLAACRLLGAPTDVDGFLDFVQARWPGVREVVLEQSTQTNESARCAMLLPVLAALPQPLALIEVGASAGLCLYPDRYDYLFDRGRGGVTSVGPGSAVRLRVAAHGDVPVPAALPTVVWRAGLDLHPLDVTRDDDLAWLTACIWPEHEERRQRLLAAARIARADPPHLVEATCSRTCPG